LAANARLKGPEKWVAAAEIRKKEKKGMEKIQTTLALRNFRLNSTSGSQYFVDKYPLIEKTREEWGNVLEKRNALELKILPIAAR
jgi:hypothetical protein